ncbi:polycystin family receptor for egg jelly [Spea bombifrons]|uniref:polycystin family receptor for egg jelly n=1 Tax=Spea bombifrons TaxID=233779 RepID=UPI00234A5330|nr:polycystin family receptor for egg jelly [Spea bombifrons]
MVAVALSGTLGSMMALLALAQVLKPLPLQMTCSEPPGKVYTRLDTDIRSTCLWRADLWLSFEPTVTVSVAEKAGRPPVCLWYNRGTVFRNTSKWSGQEKMSVTSGNIVTVRCFTDGCSLPGCWHQNLTISITDQDAKFFVISPSPRVYQYDLVVFAWCAKMKSTDWRYSFSSYLGGPVTLLPSNYYVEIEDPTYPPSVRNNCSGYYGYKVTVRYSEVGQYMATLLVPGGSPAELRLTVDVEQALLHVFSAVSNQLNRTSDLRLTWTLLPLTSRVVAFQLADQNRVGSWDLTVNKYAVETEFCSPPLSLVGSALVRIHFLVNQSDVRKLGDQFYFTNGIAGLRNLGSVVLNPSETHSNVYYFSWENGLYYSFKENEAESGSSAYFIIYQEGGLNFLFHITLVGSQTYTLAAHMYLNRRNALYRSLSDMELEVHFFNSGSSPLFTPIYVVWFVPLQHPLLQCEWTFILELYGAKKSYLFKNTTYTYGDYVTNAAAYIPNSKLEFDVKLYAGFVAKVNFTKSGLKPVILKATVGSYARKVFETSVYCYKMPCDILAFSIAKPTFPSSVIRTTKGSRLSVSVSIQINCSASQGINMLWRIYRVSNEYDIPAWDDYIDLPQVSPVNQSTVEIPKFALDYGFYLFNVSIDIATADDEDASRFKSDSVVVVVEESDLVAIIAGGSFRTVGFSDSWTLNGSPSFDPDSPDPLQGLFFTWYCTKNFSDYILMRVSQNATCHPNQTDLTWITPDAMMQTMEPESLQGNRNYYFRLVISKRNKTGYFDQTVLVAPGRPPLVSVVCIENCLRILIPTDRFSLSGKCMDCSKTSRPEYEWSLYQKTAEVDLDWASKTTTGRHIAYLSIIAKAFLGIADKWYTLVLKVTTWTGAPSVYKYSFYVNSPPKYGKCHLRPSLIATFGSKLTINCSGFHDRNLPLSYKVIAALNRTTFVSSLRENSLGSVVYYGYEPSIQLSLLPVSLHSQAYLKLYVQVYDSLSSYTQIVLFANIQDSNHTQPKEVIHKLFMLSNGSNSPMNVFLETGDFIKAGHLMCMIASLLNNLISEDFIAPIEDDKTKLRESLLTMSSSMAVTNVMSINQIITSISELTQVKKEISLKSQQLSVEKLAEAAASVNKYRKETLGSVESERLSSGILTSLSNLIGASLLNIPAQATDVPAHTVDVPQKILSVAETVTDVVSVGKVPGENDTVMESKNFKITLKKEERWDLVDSYNRRLDCLSCFFPVLQNKTSVMPVDAVVDAAFYEFKVDPLPWLNNGREIDTVVTGFYMASARGDGRVINIVPEIIDITMERKSEVPIFDISVSPDVEKTTSGVFSFEINLTSKAEWFVQFFYTKDITFNVSVHIGENMTDNPSIALFSIGNGETGQSKTKESVLRTWNPKIIRIPTESIPMENSLNLSVEMTTSYIVWKKTPLLRASIYNVACLDFEEGENWNEANCKAGPLTDNKRVHCVCQGFPKAQKRSFTFLKKKHIFLAARVFVSPNPIDLTKATFRDLRKNFATLVTVLVMFTLYAALGFWANKWDKSDVTSKQKVIVLQDNDPYDTESYIVSIYTGSRLGSGTTADVYLKIIGKNLDSDVHLLRYPGQKPFSAGRIDNFLITTKQDLGDICYIRIWHNNSGNSPGWYLSRVRIERLHTERVWYFMCRKWFDIEKGDGKIDRFFFQADLEKPLAKIDFLLINLSWKLYEEHSWLAVFAPALSDSVTRFQRLSCCFVILMSDLLVNMAFFGAEEDEAEGEDLQFIQSLIIGIQSSLITIPVELFVQGLFKSPQDQCSTSSISESHGFRDSLHAPAVGRRKDLETETDSLPNSYKSQRIQRSNCFIPDEWANESVTVRCMYQKYRKDRCKKCDAKKISKRKKHHPCKSKRVQKHNSASPSSFANQIGTIRRVDRKSRTAFSRKRSRKPDKCANPEKLTNQNASLISIDWESRTDISRKCNPKEIPGAGIFPHRKPQIIPHKDCVIHEELTNTNPTLRCIDGESGKETSGKSKSAKVSERETLQRRESQTVPAGSVDPKPRTDICRKTKSQIIPTGKTFQLNFKQTAVGQRLSIVLRRWGVHMAWILVIVVWSVSACCIVLYGLSYGTNKSRSWLFASVTSFVQSVFVVQIAQIVLTSAFHSCRTKYCHDITWSGKCAFEIPLDNIPKNEERDKELHYKLKALRNRVQYQPPKPEDIILAKTRCAIKRKAYVFCVQMIIRLVFLSVVLGFCYSNHDVNLFHHSRAAYKQFSRNLENVDRLNRIYAWTSKVLVPLIHDDKQPTFLGGSWSKIIGLPRIRRVKNTYCYGNDTGVRGLLIGKESCAPEPAIGPPKKNESNAYNPSEYDGFTFEDGIPHWNYSLPGAAFGTAGYPVYLFPDKPRDHSLKKIRDLEEANWLNEETQAVVVELATFNVYLRLFCTITVGFQVSSVGLVNQELSVRSFTLPTIHDARAADLLIGSLFFAFTFVYIAEEIYRMCAEKKKYLCISKGLNLVFKCSLLLACALYLAKFILSAHLLHLYSHHPKQFIPLYVASKVDATFRNTLGFLAFCTTLKTLKYVGLLYDVQLAHRSLTAAASAICPLGFVVGVCFVAYSSFSCLVFGRHEWEFHSFVNSVQTVFSSNVLVGGFYFSLFVLVTACILIRLFQAIVLSSYETSKQSTSEEAVENAKVVAFLKNSFWAFLSGRHPGKDERDILYADSQDQNENSIRIRD